MRKTRLSRSENASPQRLQQLDKRFLAYALAASGAVTLTPYASAEIVFTKTNITLTSWQTLNIDLNHDGIPDFTLHNYSTGYSSLYVQKLTVQGGADASAKVIGRTHYGRPNAWAAPLNWSIGPNSPKGFVNVQGVRAIMASGLCTFYCNTFGAWGRATDKFLGFQFSINGQIHYGWARLSARLKGNDITAILTGYAYETQANTAILAGDRGPVASASDATDEDVSWEEPSLGLLSLGSTGLEIWRPKQRLDRTGSDGG